MPKYSLKAGYRLLFLFVVLAGCRYHPASQNKPVHVETETATAGIATFYDEIKGYGMLQPVRSLDLEAKFDGIVRFQNLNRHIRKGMLIYTMSGPEINLQKENLEKKLAVAKTQYRYYQQYYEAKKKLAENNYLSRIEFEKVTGDLQNARNNLNRAQYALDYFLSFIRYKAPFDGYLDRLKVPQGEDAVAGQLIGVFQDDDSLKLVAPFYGDPGRLPTGEISLKIGHHFFKGKPIYIEKAVHPATGGHTLWVALGDKQHFLKSGEMVSFTFLLNRRWSVAVPVPAVIRQGEQYFVVCLKNHRYLKIGIVPGVTQNGRVEIKKGLKKGSIVLTRGAFEIFHQNIGKTMQIED